MPTAAQFLHKRGKFLKSRASPEYFGYVVGSDPHPKNPEKVLWRVRIQTEGPYYRRRATIELSHVPAGIAVGMDVRFDLASAGSNGGLIATNVILSIRQSGNSAQGDQMKRIISSLVVLVSFLTLLAGTVSAQTPFGSPDDRYKGYPSSLVPKFKMLPDLTVCAAQKPYEPADTHLMKYTNRVKVARIRIQENDECAGMRTAAGDKWVIRVKGTKVAQDELGRDLFDYGSPTGSICGNARPFSIPVNVPPPPARIVMAEPPVVTPEPTPRAPRAPRVRPVPSPVPVYTPPSPPRTKEKEPSGIVVTAGVGYVFGSVHTDYTYPDPKKGDVPQRHNFATPVVTLRVDQTSDHGIFAEVTGTFLGKTSAMEFQDITGAWITKKRDTDTTRDTSLGLKAGYKFAVGDIMSVGASVNYDRFCLCEQYHAQNTDTETQRSFQTFGLGLEASGSTDSDEHKLTIRAGGTLGLGGNRNKWTTQTYQGPPAPITFPKVTDDQQSAKLNRIGAEVDVQAVGHVHVFANVYRSAWSSSRPTAHPATTEDTTSMATTVGVRWAF